MSDKSSLRPRSTRTSAINHRFNKVTTAVSHNGSNKPVSKPTELYPGLNDITDAFEALPSDMIRYFTLLKEIDAKCVQPLPDLESEIIKFNRLQNNSQNSSIRNGIMQEITRLINEILPCLEEKMHVASIAADKAFSYIERINDDYKLIFEKEIPEVIRFGESNHPAIMDIIKPNDSKSAQSQRSELRREALAARKATTDTDNEVENGSTKNGKRRAETEGTPVLTQNNSSNSNTGNKKRKSNNVNNSNQSSTVSSQNLVKNEEISRPSTPSSGAAKKRQTQKKKSSESVNHDSVSLSSTSAGGPKKKVSSDEPLYCYCNQVSYGEMVGCDGEDCKREWFHLPCIGLTTLPKGKWYCDECSSKLKKAKKNF
ncbi:hypothetical protein WICMUC_000466 [Wickerhamomyces mucosus]|uniref:Chromatin modification-related protein n=1 Tax=Wickerhamomyces mucosus TaxID=1378264 RepID=A0A9P8PXL0_9ASCO|nr:hypothetical protein WICMUC_000466 [Wickerhamomyces mucosus]